VRPNSPGTILDASVLIALPRSIYAQTIIDLSVRMGRPLVIPAAALYAAVVAGIDPAAFDADGYTITPVNQAIIPGLAALARTASGPVELEIVHTAWEAHSTGYPVLTESPGPYAYLTIGIDLEIL
jgi:hypothetical protein